MTRDEIKNQLNGIFRDIFDDSALEVTETMAATDVAGWDSLNHVTLIVAIEKKFKLRFMTREVQALKNVGGLMDLIQAKCGTVATA